jgi:hypothetical protein
MHQAQGTFCEGTTDLVGCLGVPRFSVATPDMAKKLSPISVHELTDGSRRIMMHYMTEPTKVNFVGVTSFLNGALFGVDYIHQGFPGKKPLRADDFGTIGVLDNHGHEMPVYDASILAERGAAFLEQYPIQPGSLVFEAHKELFVDAKFVARCSGQFHSEGIRVWALLAIGVPEDPSHNYLLMEDAGFVRDITSGCDAVTCLAMAKSIIACQAVENGQPGPKVSYKEVLILGGFANVPVGSHLQVQLIYLKPPECALE